MHGRGACVAGVVCMVGGMHGGVHGRWGACVAGGACMAYGQ